MKRKSRSEVIQIMAMAEWRLRVARAELRLARADFNSALKQLVDPALRSDPRTAKKELNPI